MFKYILLAVITIFAVLAFIGQREAGASDASHFHALDAVLRIRAGRGWIVDKVSSDDDEVELSRMRESRCTDDASDAPSYHASDAAPPRLRVGRGSIVEKDSGNNEGDELSRLRGARSVLPSHAKMHSA
ncbi:hypothetical protein PFISCL1PPCAC_8583 [Pristionchus fissidentatus]|uniref:Uncharacterized protein n=1 Tax=Pristionchus fissidentatus TaxID=1538716 RepID=A0AAV5VF15_9BILA|nr:hypothetical protein PFISCL1PPCAC_8583 [Pristionchus fissidentatus]